MFPAQRLGDVNSAGGANTLGAISVMINGVPAGMPGGMVTPHPPCPTVPSHCSANTVSSCTSVILEFRPMLRTDIDFDTCAHPRTGGALDVFVGP